MGTMIFFDTGAWVALSVPGDQNAAAARQTYADVARGAHGAIVTTNFVLDEAATLVRTATDVESASRLVRSILRGQSVTLVGIDPSHFEAALEMFERFRDKRWSYTDCTSFVVMRDLGITKAFAFDRNFDEAGFNRFP